VTVVTVTASECCGLHLLIVDIDRRVVSGHRLPS